MASGTITRPHSDSPLVKMINQTVVINESTTLTLNAGGWLDIRKAKPTTPTGYTLLFAIVKDWKAGESTPKVAFMVTHDGSYIIGTANQVIAELGIMYYYIFCSKY